jgi:hypothetical protein
MNNIKLLFVAALALSSQGLLAQSSHPWGSYPNRPLALQDLVPPNGRSFSLVREFNYIDQNNRLWPAPARLIVDGASIPFPFWSIIGGPFEGLYREASVAHDAGCCAQMQPWQDTHHMFYNAMRCSGVDWTTAKTMFYAVWAFGPRWRHLNTSMPANCMIAQISRPAGTIRSFQIPSSITARLTQEITTRTLSLPETRAVARPFFTHGPMTDANATAFVTQLRARQIKPEEQQAIALSVMQSEVFSDEEVNATRQWIERENPSLESIEARAETKREQRNFEPRLFPQVRELKDLFR